jgi:hypothetical protein
MNEIDTTNQLVYRDRPIIAWGIAVFMVLMAVVLFTMQATLIPAIIFLVAALLLILVNPMNTITADRMSRTLTKSTRSIFGNKVSEYHFNDIASFEVEASRNQVSTRHRTVNYRLVMVQTNGEKIPLQDVFTSFYDDKARKAKALSQFLNLQNWEDKPTNLFQTAMQGQVEMTAIPALSKEGTTSGVNWKISVHTVGGKPVTRWISESYMCPGNFLLVSQKPANSPTLGSGGGFLGSLVTMVYQQILGMYGFLPSDTPGYSTANPVTTQDDRFDRNFGTLTNELSFGKSLLNPWTLPPFIKWAERYPLKTINSSDQVGQLAVLYSPRGLQAAILGSLPPNEFDELISMGVELVKAQGGGQPTA